MRRCSLYSSLTFPLILCSLSVSGAALLINNQPFPIHMPVMLRHVADIAGHDGEKIPAQLDGSNVVLIADVAAHDQRSFQPDLTAPAPKQPALVVAAVTNGIALAYQHKPLGEIQWCIVLKDARASRGEKSESSTKLDFDHAFNPLPLRFARAREGNLFDLWHAETTDEGLKLSLDIRAFHSGFLDIAAKLTNQNASKTTNVYAAVICRWEQAGPKDRTLCYDNHITNLPDTAWSPFREGEGRHQFIQRGTDWIRTSFDGASVAWLNDFAPSFTIQVPATAKTPAHYTGANLPQLGQEVQTKGSRLYSITEIARSSIRSFRDRLKENMLPPKGESVSFASRLIFGKEGMTDARADQMFVGWTSYNEQAESPDGFKLSFGTRSVRFGTSYFPYSTLGENFDTFKLPGMDRESFWPLAADTVNKWPLFADDIRRDLRIAKSMGFQLIRLHHLELLAPIAPKTRREYLDFLFGELRHLQLKALIDIYASPEQISALLQRYGDAVDALEVENEVLIWGIPLDRPEYWKEVYAAVKKTAPHVRVHFTGYNNTGMFDRLTALGVPYDRVCLHSYIDTLDAIPSARGYSLALSSYASKAGKPPLITEWNWRGLTRMTEEARAKIYPQIIEGAISTRGIPDFYEFQFNETLCPNPRAGRGNILRHYELLHLSRRLKPEAFVLEDIIRKYSAANDPVRLLSITSAPIVLDERGHGEGSCTLQNLSNEDLSLKLAVESDDGITATANVGHALVIPGNGAKTFRIKFSEQPNYPGFYYAFLRLEGQHGFLRYATVQAEKQGRLNLSPESSRPPFKSPSQVVYGNEAPVLEVETAIAVAETAESASGIPTEALPVSEVKQIHPNEQLFVGTLASLTELGLETPQFSGTNGFAGTAQSRNHGSLFVITGKDSREVENAGMNFILSYWKTAKDSAARKVGLVAKELPRGIDATKLP